MLYFDFKTLNKSKFAMNKQHFLKKTMKKNASILITLLYLLLSFLFIVNSGHDVFTFINSDYNLNFVIDNREIYFLIISTIFLYFLLRKKNILSNKIIENDNQLSKVFHFLPIGMQILNIKTGKCLKVNKQLCKITGYSVEEYMSSHFFTYKLWLDEGQRLASYEKLKKERKLVNIEANIRAKNGDIVTVLFNVEMLDDIGKDIALISITNISEEREIRETIKQLANNVAINKQDKFYHQIISQIAKIFGADSVLITQLNDHTEGAVDTLSYYQDGSFEANFSFLIKYF